MKKNKKSNQQINVHTCNVMRRPAGVRTIEGVRSVEWGQPTTLAAPVEKERAWLWGIGDGQSEDGFHSCNPRASFVPHVSTITVSLGADLLFLSSRLLAQLKFLHWTSREQVIWRKHREYQKELSINGEQSAVVDILFRLMEKIVFSS